ncbi:MAG: ATP-binding protein [Actinomycetota bacterium]|nr:ATP-binding protein [Actinomycetota bacterium]
MPTLRAPSASAATAAETERVVAWLRLPAIALLALGEGLEHPNPKETAFVITLACFSAWSAGLLAWVHLRRIGPRAGLAATGVDVAALSVLSVLSGGAFSHARLGFFIIPVTVAFRFRPSVTAAAAVVTTAAYVVQAVAHPARDNADGPRFIATQAGFLLWVGLACVLLSLLLARRTDVIFRLAESRTQLLADALSAEQRERKALAEALHDDAMQNLLSARHEIEEASDASAHPALARADRALSETIGQLRNAVFELHPYVLEEAGLESGVRAVAQQAASRAGFALELDLRYAERHPQEQLLFSAARELLANIVEHAEASRVHVSLTALNRDVALVVEDDGKGFPPERLAERLADGHVGLASQRVRVEAAGGRMTVASRTGGGTRAEIRLPDRRP